jgi:hypothetical protein
LSPMPPVWTLSGTRWPPAGCEASAHQPANVNLAGTFRMPRCPDLDRNPKCLLSWEDEACQRSPSSQPEGTFRAHTTAASRPELVASADGHGVVSHAGTGLLADLPHIALGNSRVIQRSVGGSGSAVRSDARTSTGGWSPSRSRYAQTWAPAKHHRSPVKRQAKRKEGATTAQGRTIGVARGGRAEAQQGERAPIPGRVCAVQPAPAHPLRPCPG